MQLHPDKRHSENMYVHLENLNFNNWYFYNFNVNALKIDCFC